MRALALALLLLASPALAADASENGLALLRDRAVGLMRHGGAVPATPGTLPPVLGCNPGAVLTTMGREEMRRWGEHLRAGGLADVRFETSRQCSAWETALLLGLGPVAVNPELDPAADRGELEQRGEALRRLLLSAAQARESGAGPMILMTHRANIASLTGIELGHGEVLLLTAQPNGLSLIGRISVE
jgi:hypothetical protein